MIGKFDLRGFLEPGIHQTTWPEFHARFGTNSVRISQLVGLGRAAFNLEMAGCRMLWIDGSFVTAKKVPNDYEAVWSIDGVNLDLLDPVFLKWDDGFRQQRLKYLGEFFPESTTERMTGLPFLEYFQHDADTGRPKGIVSIKLGGNDD